MGTKRSQRACKQTGNLACVNHWNFRGFSVTAASVTLIDAETDAREGETAKSISPTKVISISVLQQGPSPGLVCHGTFFSTYNSVFLMEIFILVQHKPLDYDDGEKAHLVVQVPSSGLRPQWRPGPACDGKRDLRQKN